MAHGASQFDMSHAFPADLRAGHFDAAFIADDSLVAYSLVLTAVTFEVLGWAKDSLAEEAIPFWFQGTIVDGLWLGYLTIGPASNLFW